ncbi:MAG: hypothetical protein KIS92_00575 [Planctomycetota bacterium]|nr:hypothetical protein [Planctomycetota bacterium]
MASNICVSCHAPANERCHTCHKPVCGKCVVPVGSNTFCTKACAENYAKFNARYKGEGSGFVGKLVKLAVVLAILGGVALFVGAKVLKIGFCVELLKKIGM